MAAANKNLELCKLILLNEADKNPRDKKGNTPLHEAAENGHLDVCKLIMDNISDKNPTNRYGDTPLHGAAQYLVTSP